MSRHTPDQESKQMTSSQISENPTQSRTCRCAEKDTNIWSTTTSENNSDKQSNTCSNCQVVLSGAGSKEWATFHIIKRNWMDIMEKRWFILTRTSLVFFRSDPNIPQPKGAEPNLTLGGIDLNSSGSVVVKADKKLLTVLFPDGRDGRAFTLKAETSEDLCEWKTALENALTQAPSAANAMGQNTIFRNDLAECESSADQSKDKLPAKSLVVGRPILLALEDIDGSPSFLEKALRFIENYGIKVEGILRQSADVEEVERRVQEYEQGKMEFSSDEDAHVIGDCIKHVLRELPSSPVPASCCTALVEAYRTDRGSRLNAIRMTISETFPEPNRRLLQRILKMMRTVAAYKHENRMSLSALAACMAPLLLRPLLAGDCEIEDDFSMGGGGSIQLLKAAAAANHAQAIVIILLEEYDKIFDDDLLEDGSVYSDLYSESENDDLEDEESILDNDGYEEDDNDLDADIEDDNEYSSNGSTDESENCSDAGTDSSEIKGSEDRTNNLTSSNTDEDFDTVPAPFDTTNVPALEDFEQKKSSHADRLNSQLNNDAGNNSSSHSHLDHSNSPEARIHGCHQLDGDIPFPNSDGSFLLSNASRPTEKSDEPQLTTKRTTVWGRTPGRKNLSMESIEISSDDEISIKRLEMTKGDLQNKLTAEVEVNATLQGSLEKRKEALNELRLALEQDVGRLREELQRERDKREALESGLTNMQPGQLLAAAIMDSKTRADLEDIAIAEADIFNLKQTVADLQGQLGHQLQFSSPFLCESCKQPVQTKESFENPLQAEVASLVENENMSQNADKFLRDVCENGDIQTSKTISSERGTCQKEEPELKSGSSIAPSFVGNIAPARKQPTKETSASVRNFSAMNANASTLEGSEDLKVQVHVPPSSSNKEPPQKQDMRTNQKNIESRSNSVYLDPKATASKPTSRRTTCRGENSITGADLESMRSQSEDLPSAPEKQPVKKHEMCRTSLGSLKHMGCSGSLSTAESVSIGQNVTSKRSLPMTDSVKNEAKDSASSNNQQVQKLQQNASVQKSTKSQGSNAVSSSDETAIEGNRYAASRRLSSKEEISITSSSALTRLTNRLNFLKERRVQLVNELQNLETNCALGQLSSSGTDRLPPQTNQRLT